MQNYPGYNPNAPGAPMHNGFQQPGFGHQPGFGPQQGFGGPGMGPQRPGAAGPCFGMGMGPMQQQPQPGCFMPAATIRKISNTMPPAQFFNPPN